jgi:hypothetical protein
MNFVKYIQEHTTVMQLIRYQVHSRGEATLPRASAAWEQSIVALVMDLYSRGRARRGAVTLRAESRDDRSLRLVTSELFIVRVQLSVRP